MMTRSMGLVMAWKMVAHSNGRRKSAMKNSTLKSLVFLMVGALMLVASCSVPEIEEVVEINPRTTIPFSVVVATDMTKVSYADAKYAFKAGDSFVVESDSSERDDIEGTLAFNGTNKLTGKISFDSDKPLTNSTRLKITLINADYSDRDSYAKGIAATLQEAVEKYSLFTTTLLFNDATTESSPQRVSFAQQAAFLEITVNFTNLLTSSMPTGKTPVELATADGLKVSGKAEIIKVGSEYKATFVAALPGGTEMQGSKLSVCEREIDILSSSKAIEKNKQYKVARSVDFRPQVGDPYWSDGSYGAIEHAGAVEIIGIIVYVDQEGTNDDEITAKSYGFGHALVMSLHNANTTGVQWGLKSSEPRSSTTRTTGQAVASMNGYGKTVSWLNSLEESDVTAAYVARHYREAGGSLDVPSGSTGWFLASTGQWLHSISDPGFLRASSWTTWKDGNNNAWYSGSNSLSSALAKVMVGQTALTDLFNTRFEELRSSFAPSIPSDTFFDHFGMQLGNDLSDNYWTSDEWDKDNALRMNFGAKDNWSSIKINAVNKESKNYTFNNKSFYMKIRPFLAF